MYVSVLILHANAWIDVSMSISDMCACMGMRVCVRLMVCVYVGLLVCLCTYSRVCVHDCMAALMYVSYICCTDLKIFAFKQGTFHASLIMYCNRERAFTNKRLNMSSAVAEHT